MDILIVTLVVVITVLAHVYIYRWVKFKMDEGAVQQYLHGANKENEPMCRSLDAIAKHTGLGVKRVAVICQRSKVICATDIERTDSVR